MSRNDFSYLSKPFVLSLVLSMFVIMLFLFIGVNQGYNVSIEEANRTLTEVEQLRESTTLLSIFVNNAEIALLTLIPSIGIIWMIIIQYNTGFIIGNLTKAIGANQYYLASLIVTDPVGLMEFSAYILVLAESFVLVYSIIKKEFKDRLFKHTWKTVLVVVMLLLVSAFFEYWWIKSF